MNSIFTRRSMRLFEDKDVEAEKIERILKAGMQAPSAHNLQPWEFIVVKNKETREKISEMSPYANPAKNANTAIIVLADMDRVKKEDLWWQQDISACIENMLIQSVEEELGAVWLGFYPMEDRVKGLKELFNLPDNIIPFSVIALGYSERENKFVDRYDSSRVFFETYK